MKWSFDEAIDGWQPYVTSAVVSREGGVHVMAPTDAGYRVFALAPASGSVRWSQRLDSRGLYPADPQSPPWVEDGRVYVSTQRDILTITDAVHGSTQVFDAATGEDLGVVGDGGDLQAITEGFGVLVVRDSAFDEGGISGAMYSGRFSGDFAATPLRRTDLYAGDWSAQSRLGGVTIGDGVMLHTGLGVLSSAPGPAQLGTALRGYPITFPGEVGCGPVTPAGLMVECPAWVTPRLDLLPGSAPVVDPAAHRVYVSANFDGVRARCRRRIARTGRAAAGGRRHVVFVPVMADGQRPRLVAFDADGCGHACDAICGHRPARAWTDEVAITRRKASTSPDRTRFVCPGR